MATTADNTKAKDVNDRISYTIDTTGSNDINAGDMVYFDTSAHQAKSAATDANCQYFAGVAEDTSYKNPFGTKKYDPMISVFKEGIFWFKTTTSESYFDGTPVSIGADAQTVTTVGGTYPVGTVHNPGSTAAITGASGTSVMVIINPRFPFLGV